MRTQIVVMLALILIPSGLLIAGQNSSSMSWNDSSSEFGELSAAAVELRTVNEAVPGIVKATVAKGGEPKISTVRERKKEWVNAQCKATDTCDLKRFTLTQRDYKVMTGGDANFGTRMILSYETDKLDAIERYGVAQFIKGCQFSSGRRSTGEIVKVLDIDREFNGKSGPYHHPNWVLDRVTPDPIDWGFSENSPNRHFFYWNSVPGSTSGNQKYYGFKKPDNPILYLRDLPGSAFFAQKSAKNISLQFRTCIYKSADVPMDIPAEKLDFAQPLACLEWSSSWIYNHAKGKFESPSALDPVCQ